MDELIELVADKAGLSPQVARTVVNTVLDLPKDRLPGPVSSQIDGLLGGSGGADAAKDALGKLGGLAGKK